MNNENFKKFYTGYKAEYQENLYLLKTLKRQITSYLKESSLERLHGIFNKIFILRKCIDKDNFYHVLLEGMNSTDKENFLKFILKEGFEFEEELLNEEKVEDIWEHQLALILKKYRKI